MGESMRDGDLVMPAEAGALLKLSREQVLKLDRQGRLASVRTTNGVRLFWRRDIEALAAERRRNPPRPGRPPKKAGAGERRPLKFSPEGSGRP